MQFYLNLISFITYISILYIFIQDIYVDIRILQYEFNFIYKWNLILFSILSIIYLIKKIYYFYIFLLISYIYVFGKISKILF